MGSAKAAARARRCWNRCSPRAPSCNTTQAWVQVSRSSGGGYALRTVHPHWTKPAQSASRGRWTVRQRGSGIVQRHVRRSEDRCRGGCTYLRRSCGSWVGSDADGGDQAATREQGRASRVTRSDGMLQCVQNAPRQSCGLRCAPQPASGGRHGASQLAAKCNLTTCPFLTGGQHESSCYFYFLACFGPHVCTDMYGNPSSVGGAFFRAHRPARRHVTADRVC